MHMRGSTSQVSSDLLVGWQDGVRSSFDVIYIRPASPVTRGGLLQSIENGLLVVSASAQCVNL